MSADKYPCIFSRQMETIVYVRLFRFFNAMLLHEKDSIDEDDMQEDMQAKISADCYRNRAGQLRILSFCPSVFSV